MIGKELFMKTHTILNMIRGLRFGYEEDLRAGANNLGLSYPGFRLIWILQFEPEMTVTQLSKIGLWDISTTQRIINTLLKENFVKVDKAINDNRIKMVSLTEKSKEIIINLYKGEIVTKPKVLTSIEKVKENYSEKSFNDFLKIGCELCEELVGKEYVNWIFETEKKIENQ